MEELSDRCYPRNYFDPYGNEKEEMECCETCGEPINDCQCIDCEECGKPTMVEDFVLDPRPMELENVCKECEKKFLAELVQGVNSSSHHPKLKGDNEEDVLYARSQAKVEKAVRAARKVFAKELESMKSA